MAFEIPSILEKELSDENVATLAEEFTDLVKRGTIEKTTALPDEQNEPDLWNRPRIRFTYNRQSPSRLIEMIHRINELGRG